MGVPQCSFYCLHGGRQDHVSGHMLAKQVPWQVEVSWTGSPCHGALNGLCHVVVEGDYWRRSGAVLGVRAARWYLQILLLVKPRKTITEYSSNVNMASATIATHKNMKNSVQARDGIPKTFKGQLRVKVLQCMNSTNGKKEGKIVRETGWMKRKVQQPNCAQIFLCYLLAIQLMTHSSVTIGKQSVKPIATDTHQQRKPRLSV